MRTRKNFSEREFVKKAQISRGTLRQIEENRGNPTLKTLQALAEELGKRLVLLWVPLELPKSEYSVVVASMKIMNEGFDSWKGYLMEFVDTYRVTLDPRLFLLPPLENCDQRLQALFASTVLYLCRETHIEPPDWSKRKCFLEEPWFVSGMESLKASAILESPLEFRKNNVYVLSNFLSRA